MCVCVCVYVCVWVCVYGRGGGGEIGMKMWVKCVMSVDTVIDVS